jgi:hypothetical protein
MERLSAYRGCHKSEDGGIVVRLDAGEVVKSGNIFILTAVRQLAEEIQLGRVFAVEIF